MMGMRWRESRMLTLPSHTWKPRFSFSMGLSSTGVGQRHVLKIWLFVCTRAGGGGARRQQRTCCEVQCQQYKRVVARTIWGWLVARVKHAQSLIAALMC